MLIKVRMLRASLICLQSPCLKLADLVNKVNWGITDIKFKDEPFTKLINLHIRYLENVESHNSVTTITDDGRVAIHCLAEKPLVIIIKNKFLAETYKNYFEVLWKVAKP